jgi:hypothetical protein
MPVAVDQAPSDQRFLVGRRGGERPQQAEAEAEMDEQFEVAQRGHGKFSCLVCCRESAVHCSLPAAGSGYFA